MITKELFNKNVIDIIESGLVENYKLINKEFEKDIIFNNRNNKIIFNKFKENYLSTYGNDISNLFMKIQDFVYQLNLLINYYLDFGFNSELLTKNICDFIEDSEIDIFNGCNYDSSDLNNIIENMDLEQMTL